MWHNLETFLTVTAEGRATGIKRMDRPGTVLNI